MMAITSINDSNSLPSGVISFEAEQRKEKERSSVLGQEDFLKLLTTQLQNQDPMQPMENGEFLGQMAQFSSVASLGEMSNQLKSLAESMQSSRMLSTASLIGREVLAPASTGYLPEGGELEGLMRLDQPADNVQLQIKSQLGQVMQTVDLGARTSGDYPFSWDGSLSDGAIALPGIYRMELSVRRGQAVTAEKPLTYLPVTSVDMKGANLLLNLASGDRVEFNDVTSMR
jgi:flagellar basal-body rod modification protein FlgD